MSTKEQKQNRNFIIFIISIILFLIAMATVVLAQPLGGQLEPPSIPNSKQIIQM